MTARPRPLRSLSAPALIAAKRDGKALSAAEIQWLVDGFVRGDVADYQMTAWAMAVYFQGMSHAETTALTLAMQASGRTADLRQVPGIKVDKHSTGGVGDKVSICLAPLVAACGVPVPMISGRGLGHTGGTLDKLEAVAGLRVDLTLDAFVKQLKQLGVAMIGQTRELAPADKRLYALRDVTATVESIPLITASILSKKLAEGIDALVLDVKVGRGAFMKTEAEAIALARSLVKVGKLANKRVTALITRMDAPLGMAIGNALETAEAFRVLHGQGADDLVECTLALGAEMLRLGGVARSTAQARQRLLRAIRSGDALRKAQALVQAQGGDPRGVAEPDRLLGSTRRVAVRAEHTGFVADVDALTLARLAMRMGAGRMRADQAIDPQVGILLAKKPGDAVQTGEPLAWLHLGSSRGAAALTRSAREAFRLGRRAPKATSLIVRRLRG